MNYAAIPAVLAGIYYMLALVAAIRHPLAREHQTAFLPPESILKPIHGRDPHFYEAIRSQAAQDYPEFEILFGVRDPADPAVADIERLQREYPQRGIHLVPVTRKTRNGKVGALADLAAQAKYPVLLVSDSDICVEPGYLRSVVAPLEDAGVGMVTCLYRARGESRPSRWEAIGVATEFVPSVLVARLVGVAEFALGSTMVFRAEQIARIGGFMAVADYLADDYQLGARVAALGYRVALAKTVVETELGCATWREVWRHQLRWARTIRVSQRGGYIGYAVTHATIWSIVAIAAGAWPAGVAALAMRMAAGIVTATAVLRYRGGVRDFMLIPARDLWGFAIWICGLFGDTVEWRGIKLKLTRDGKIRPAARTTVCQ